MRRRKVSLLSIAQSLMLKVMSSKPSAAATSSDPKVLQAVEYINEAGQELAARATWQALTVESTFNTVATQSQGVIQTLAGADFAFLVNNTMWDRTTRRPIFGPKSDAQWQQLMAQFNQGPYLQYRIRGNKVLFLPVPPVGDVIYFEWISKNWCQSIALTGQTSMLADTDTAKLDERVIALDALWRFKRANKLAYDEDFDKAEDAIKDLIGRDASKPTLNLGGGQTDVLPAILVPAGSWGP
jgi:hypothetical protein